MIEIAYWLWETNPLAGWLVDVTTAFILAEGMPYEAKHEDTKAVLDGFWHDPINRMPLYFPKHVNELQIYGELCPLYLPHSRQGVHDTAILTRQHNQVITDPTMFGWLSAY